jgi:hypothetical protein
VISVRFGFWTQPSWKGLVVPTLPVSTSKSGKPIPAGGDPKSALIIDRTVDDGLVLRFTAGSDKKDDPRLKVFIQVFNLPEVKQFIEEKIPAFIPPVSNS